MKEITVYVNGKPVQVPEGASAATAINKAGEISFRQSVKGDERAPLCGMGICFECRVEIDGEPHQLACKRTCCNGTEIKTL